MASSQKTTSVRRIVGLLLGLITFIVIVVDLPGFGLERNAQVAAAVIALMAIWWISLAIPLAVTSLVPIVAFPLLGVMKSSQVVKFYANDNIYLFLGGFIIALAIERWNLHRRMALWMMLRIGNRPSFLVLGFLVTSAALSMWISNTATTMMMLPIGMAVVAQIAENDEKLGHRFAPALMLAIAYGASVGGIGTPIGTPPNIVFIGQFEELFPTAARITFFDWAKVFIPLAILLLPVVWLVLTKVVFRLGRPVSTTRTIIEHQYRQLGTWRPPEFRVFLVFVSTAMLWIFRSDIIIERLTIPGWSNVLPHPELLNDATVAIAMAILLFIIPSGDRKKPGPLMNWTTALRVPWGILLLFGGGFAVAGAFSETGLDRILGEALRPLMQGLGPWTMVLIVCVFVTFLTELTSNTATAAAMIPIMAATALALGMNPLLLMVPTTISASCAFMLPVATPPNAIIFGSGHVRMGQMVGTGLILNLIIAVIVTTFIHYILLPAWNLTPSLPAWVK